ncbi:MAG: hypothetical protein WB762_21700 [Candidatus Sulfotelmatobacter sp.]
MHHTNTVRRVLIAGGTRAPASGWQSTPRQEDGAGQLPETLDLDFNKNNGVNDCHKWQERPPFSPGDWHHG